MNSFLNVFARRGRNSSFQWGLLSDCKQFVISNLGRKFEEFPE